VTVPALLQRPGGPVAGATRRIIGRAAPALRSSDAGLLALALLVGGTAGAVAVASGNPSGA